jgi:hypothetical protein
MALQPFVGHWFLFQFRDPIHSRKDCLDRGSARRKASAYTKNNTNTENTQRHPCIEWDSNPWTQCLSSRRKVMPQTAKPLWLASKEGTTFIYDAKYFWIISSSEWIHKVEHVMRYIPDMGKNHGHYCSGAVTVFASCSTRFHFESHQNTSPQHTLEVVFESRKEFLVAHYVPHVIPMSPPRSCTCNRCLNIGHSR